jgi:hypothetical protein
VEVALAVLDPICTEARWRRPSLLGVAVLLLATCSDAEPAPAHPACPAGFEPATDGAFCEPRLPLTACSAQTLPVISEATLGSGVLPLPDPLQELEL